jgi:hypothetical protein
MSIIYPWHIWIWDYSREPLSGHTLLLSNIVSWTIGTSSSTSKTTHDLYWLRSYAHWWQALSYCGKAQHGFLLAAYYSNNFNLSEIQDTRGFSEWNNFVSWRASVQMQAEGRSGGALSKHVRWGRLQESHFCLKTLQIWEPGLTQWLNYSLGDRRARVWVLAGSRLPTSPLVYSA